MAILLLEHIGFL